MQQTIDGIDAYREPRFVPLTLLSGGVPNIEIHVQTGHGMVVWAADGSVRTMRTLDGWRAASHGLVGFVSLIPR